MKFPAAGPRLISRLLARYIKESIKRFGRRFDHEERMRKKKAREPKKARPARDGT